MGLGMNNGHRHTPWGVSQLRSSEAEPKTKWETLSLLTQPPSFGGNSPAVAARHRPPCWGKQLSGGGGSLTLTPTAKSGFPNRSQVWARCPRRKWGAGPQAAFQAHCPRASPGPAPWTARGGGSHPRSSQVPLAQEPTAGGLPPEPDPACPLEGSHCLHPNHREGRGREREGRRGGRRQVWEASPKQCPIKSRMGSPTLGRALGSSCSVCMGRGS